MNSQSLILVASALFVSVIVATLAYDEFQQREHSPSEPEGLIWQVNAAFDRVRDLEIVFDIEMPADSYDDGVASRALGAASQALPSPLQVLLRYLNDGQPALSLRFPVGDQDLSNDELLVVDGGRLSHYLPEENTIITRYGLSRLSLAQIALSGFRLAQVDESCEAGSIHLTVEQDISGLPPNLFQPSLRLETTLSGEATSTQTLCFRDSRGTSPYDWSFVVIDEPMAQSPIQGGYVLKVSDAETDLLQAMIWVDRTDFTVRKIVYFVDGQRSYSLRVERMEVNPGFTRDDVVSLPRGAREIEG